MAANTKSDVQKYLKISQGSAVAVSPTTLLTICHILDSRPYVFIIKGKNNFRVKVVSGDIIGDRCVISVKSPVLKPVIGYRAFNTLSVGDQVYTVGSPMGLENTLGQGVISGLRKTKGQRLVQTTAQISPGSSGGGLFDNAGNIIGITTFKLRNSEGLNFAISIEDFAK